MIRAGIVAGTVALGMALLTGCAAELPGYSAMSDESALRTIADRGASVRSISGECELVLTSAEGRTIHLDGVLVVEPPRRARVRAWKFGRAVFDLTVVDGEGWLLAAAREEAAAGADAERVPARRVGEVLELLGPAFFRGASPVDSGARVLTVRGHALGRDGVVCDIERRTLTARRFVVPGEAGHGSSEVMLDGYRLIGGIPWACDIRVRGPGGEIVVRVGDVELNGEIPEGAFVAPEGAIRLP